MKLQDILQLIHSIPWLVVLVLGLVYSRPFMSVLRSLDIVKVSRKGIELKTKKHPSEFVCQSHEVSQILKAIDKKIEKSSKQEKPYSDCNDALKDVEKCIVFCLDRSLKESKTTAETPKLEIKVIAVSMSFLWEFIRDKLPVLLREYPDSYAIIELVFAEHQYLESLNLEDYDISWPEESIRRVKDISRFTNDLPCQLSARLEIKPKLYKNLPHWHGVLINDEYLFLGRADWSFLRDKPRLTVGQNKYRYFDRSSSMGTEQVELFKNWHNYYLNYGSQEDV